MTLNLDYFGHRSSHPLFPLDSVLLFCYKAFLYCPIIFFEKYEVNHKILQMHMNNL